MRYLLTMLIVCLIVWLLCGCKATDTGVASNLPPAKAASVQADKATDSMRRADVKAEQLQGVVGGLAPDNVPQSKAQAETLTGGIRADLAEGIAASTGASKAAQQADSRIAQQDKQIQELKASNPFRTFLYWLAAVFFVGFIGLMLTAFLLHKFDYAVGGGFLFIASIGTGAVAHYLDTLMFVALGLMGVFTLIVMLVAGWLAWKWYKAHQNLGTVVQSVDAAKAAGLIDMAGPVADVLRVVQGDVGQVVNKLQGKTA